MGMRLTFFFSVGGIFGELQGLKEGKNRHLLQMKNIVIRILYKLVKTLLPMLGLRIWNHSIKFDYEIN